MRFASFETPVLIDNVQSEIDDLFEVLFAEVEIEELGVITIHPRCVNGFGKCDDEVGTMPLVAVCSPMKPMRFRIDLLAGAKQLLRRRRSLY